MSRIAGIDGCRAGWFVVSSSVSLSEFRWFVAEDIGSVSRQLPDLVAVGIDIPIGIPDSGSRQCDLLARQLLSPVRSASVFPAPIRPILRCRDHTQASDRRQRIDGKRISAQAFNILHKINEVDTYLRNAPGGSPPCYEVHPELAFAALNNETPMRHAKRTAPGHAERVALLARTVADQLIQDALAAHPRAQVAKDDVLDAFAVLLSAQRIVTGAARRVPDEPQLDGVGLDMAIWF